MKKWLAGIAATVIGGILVFWLTEGIQDWTRSKLMGKSNSPVSKVEIPPSPEKSLELGILAYDNKKLVEAFNYFKQAAEKGNPEAQWHFGEMLFHGEGVIPDTVKSLEWISKSAKSGFALAQSQFGNAYLTGSGVKKDSIEAEKWLRRGIMQDDVAGYYLYGQLSLPAFFRSRITKPEEDIKSLYSDCEKASAFLREAAEKGHASAQVDLGLLYLAGCGVLKDSQASIYWFGRAAAQGDIEGLNAFSAVLVSIYLRNNDKNFLKVAFAHLYSAHRVSNSPVILTTLNRIEKSLTTDELKEAKSISRKLFFKKEGKYRHGHFVESNEDHIRENDNHIRNFQKMN